MTVEEKMKNRNEKSNFFVLFSEKCISDVMLSGLVKEHQARQGGRKELQERRKQEALVAANKLTEVEF